MNLLSNKNIKKLVSVALAWPKKVFSEATTVLFFLKEVN